MILNLTPSMSCSSVAVPNSEEFRRRLRKPLMAFSKKEKKISSRNNEKQSRNNEKPTRNDEKTCRNNEQPAFFFFFF